MTEEKIEKDFYREALDEIENVRKAVEEMKPEADVVKDAVVALADNISGHPNGCSAKIRGSLGWGVGQLHGVLLHCDIQDVAEIIPVLRWFGKRGYSRNGKKAEDYAEIGRRTFTLTNKEKHTIRVSFFFPSSPGAKCRFIQTGVKEEPVYELVCEDEETESLKKQGAA